MNMHFDVDEVPCPNCNGLGGFWTEDDENNFGYHDWKLCHRCQGAGTILIKIKKDRIEEE